MRIHCQALHNQTMRRCKAMATHKEDYFGKTELYWDSIVRSVKVYLCLKHWRDLNPEKDSRIL